MSRYTESLKADIQRRENLWDLAEPAVIRELRKMKLRLWWYSGPRLFVMVVVANGSFGWVAYWLASTAMR